MAVQCVEVQQECASVSRMKAVLRGVWVLLCESHLLRQQAYCTDQLVCFGGVCCVQVELSDVVGVASVKRLERSADHSERLLHFKDDEALRKRNADAVAAGGKFDKSIVKPAWSSPIIYSQLSSWLLARAMWVQLDSVPLPILARMQRVTLLYVLVCTGKPMEYFYRHLYLPQLGMFKALPEDLQLGTFVEPPAKPMALGHAKDGGFVKEGVEYK